MKEKGGKDGEEGEKERRIGSNKEKKIEEEETVITKLLQF